MQLSRLVVAVAAAAGCAPHPSPAAQSASAGAPPGTEPSSEPAEDTSSIPGPFDHPGHPQRRADRTTAAYPDQAPPGVVWIDPGATDPVPVREAIAVLEPTKGSHVSGVVRFREDQGELDVMALVDGLTGNAHTYHVHVYGDCSGPDAESAGPYFHFSGSSFDRAPRTSTGDLGELQPDGNLTTAHRGRVDATLYGPFSILGRAVIVHERGNDPSGSPDGAAGRRLACGVIGIADPAALTARAGRRP